MTESSNILASSLGRKSSGWQPFRFKHQFTKSQGYPGDLNLNRPCNVGGKAPF